jgi:1-deoxy-D-xylulose-5-phosphate synthase
LASKHQLVVTVEDNLRIGGIGSAVSSALRSHEIDIPCRDIGIEARFLEHGTRATLLSSLGLTAQDVSRQIVETIARFDNGSASMSSSDGDSDEVERTRESANDVDQ